MISHHLRRLQYCLVECHFEVRALTATAALAIFAVLAIPGGLLPDEPGPPVGYRGSDDFAGDSALRRVVAGLEFRLPRVAQGPEFLVPRVRVDGGTAA